LVGVNDQKKEGGCSVLRGGVKRGSKIQGVRTWLPAGDSLRKDGRASFMGRVTSGIGKFSVSPGGMQEKSEKQQVRDKLPGEAKQTNR